MREFMTDHLWSIEQQKFVGKLLLDRYPWIKMQITDDKNEQKAGIDRWIELPNGTRLSLDEKVRRRNADDVLLETISRLCPGCPSVPGWAEDEKKKNDLLLYAWLPSRKGLLFCMRSLRSSLSTNKQSWISRYGTKTSHNANYDTICCPVPIPVIEQVPGTIRLGDWR